jgi:hypothetical protein
MRSPFPNNSDLGSLSFEEVEKINAAQEAFAALKKTFEHWLTIGKGLQALKAKADRLNLGRKTFLTLRTQAGFGNDAIRDATVTRLLKIMDQEEAVREWHKSLKTDKQRYAWASPDSVHRHCDLFKKQKNEDKPKKLSPMAQLKQANVMLQEEVHQLKQYVDGDRFKPTDTARDIAVAIVGTLSAFSRGKAEQVARCMLEVIKERQS